MDQTRYYPDWREKVVFSNEGPRPQVLAESDRVKLVLAGLEPGQQIPPHPEGHSIFHFLEGTGTMTVNGERYAAAPGTIVIAPAGASRSVEAATRLVFLAARIS